jgi:hypothetical protein
MFKDVTRRAASGTGLPLLQRTSHSTRDSSDRVLMAWTMNSEIAEASREQVISRKARTSSRHRIFSLTLFWPYSATTTLNVNSRITDATR